MGRKPKNPGPEKSISGERSDIEPTLEQVIPVEVEGHAPTEKTLKERAAEKFSSMFSTDDNISVVDADLDGKPKRRKGVPKAQRAETQQEFSTLVSSVFVVIFALSSWPDDIKPNDDEVDGVSIRITKILMRHVDISGKLTGDVLDIIGIIAIGSSWYARVSPMLKQLKAHNEKPVFRAYDQAVNENTQSGSEAWVTPIEQASPEYKVWLDHIEDGSGEE